MPDSENDSRQRQPKRTTEYADYVERFVLLSDRVERLLRRAVWALIALLVAAQLLLSVPPVRQRLVGVERLEGVPFERSGSESGP